MRYFTVTLTVAIDDYTVEPDPSLSALDPICMVLAEHLPEITMLDMSEREQTLVDKEGLEELIEDGVWIGDTSEDEEDDMVGYYNSNYWNKQEPTEVDKVQAQVDTVYQNITEEEALDLHNDWLASQGDQIKDAEIEQQHKQFPHAH
jgi:hypothetical protein